MPFLKRERQHPGIPDEQSDAGRVAEPVPRRDGLFARHEQREARNPVEVHHAAEKHRPHQEPAAADTESPVQKTHAERATGAPPPMGTKECQRRSAVAKAGMLDRGGLGDAGGEQQETA